MRYLLLIALFVFSLYAVDLKDILNNTSSKSGYLKAKEYELLSIGEDIDSIKSLYSPSLNFVASVDFNSPKNLTTPGRVMSLSILLNYKLYDSGKRENEIYANRLQKVAKEFGLKALKRSLSIKVVNLYYGYFKAISNKSAIVAREKEIKAQITRVKKLIDANLATKVEIDRLEATLAQSRYALDSINLSIKSFKERLKAVSHLNFKNLKYSSFKEPKISLSTNENILKLRAKANALNYNSKAIEALSKPQVDLKYRYSRLKYKKVVPNRVFDLPNHTSKLSLQGALRVYDGGVINHKSQSIKYQKLALLARANELRREQIRDFKLAKLKLKTLKSSIKSAKMALKASKSSYRDIKKKYSAGLVDYTVYIDSLTQLTISKAQYKEALYNLEVAKALVYYYGGKNLKGYIK